MSTTVSPIDLRPGDTIRVGVLGAATVIAVPLEWEAIEVHGEVSLCGTLDMDAAGSPFGYFVSDDDEVVLIARAAA